MKVPVPILVAWHSLPGGVFAADTGHALRQTGRDVVLHYGVVPAEVVLAHPDKHPERVSPEGHR